MRKRILSLLLCFVLILGLLPTAALAAEETPDATAPQQDENGTYLIGTAEELYWFAEEVKEQTAADEAADKSYTTDYLKRTKVSAKLTADINLNPGVSFAYDHETGLVAISRDGTTLYMGTGMKSTLLGNFPIYNGICTREEWDGGEEMTDEERAKKQAEYLEQMQPMLDALGLRKWTPIGTAKHPYVGDFDGDGHTIDGVYVNDDTVYNAGLFGYTSTYLHTGEYATRMPGEIKNLTLGSNSLVVGYYADYNNAKEPATGGIVGKMSFDKIESCINRATVVGEGSYSLNSSGTGHVAGVVSILFGTAKNCVNYGTIVSANSAGGVIGHLLTSKTVDPSGAAYCTNYGSIYTDTANVYSLAGGVVARDGGDEAAAGSSIISCVNRGYVEGACAAGIVQFAGDGAEIKYCANFGEIKGMSSASGLVDHIYRNGFYLESSYNAGEVELFAFPEDQLTEEGNYPEFVYRTAFPLASRIRVFNTVSDHSIKNCYNDETVCPALDGKLFGEKITNVTNCFSVPTTFFATGEPAYKMRSWENGSWMQDLPSETYPHVGSEPRVYENTRWCCHTDAANKEAHKTPFYSNETGNVTAEHDISTDGYCKHCGADCRAPILKTDALPSATEGEYYSETILTDSTAPQPTTFELVTSETDNTPFTLPTGLSAKSNDGANSHVGISGTPDTGTAGAYTFTVKATNAYGTTKKTYTLTITAGASETKFQITTRSLPYGVVNQPYKAMLESNDPKSPVIWSILKDSTPPDGIEFDEKSGALSGTPTKAGDYTLNIEAARIDSKEYAYATLTLTVYASDPRDVPETAVKQSDDTATVRIDTNDHSGTAPDVTSVVYAVDLKETDTPYVSYALQAVPGYEVQNIYDISLEQGGTKYELKADETATITLTIGPENAKLIQAGKLVLIHLPENGDSVVYGVSKEYRQFEEINAAAGTVTFKTTSCSPFLLASLPEDGGVTVSGEVTGYNGANAPVVTLCDSKGEVRYTAALGSAEKGGVQFKWTFSFSDVAAGTYDLVVTKGGHLTYTIKNVVVSGADLDLTVITLLCGDLNGDGFINSTDLGIVLQGQNYGKEVGTEGVNQMTDLNGDGWVNSTDLGIILQGQHYGKSAVSVDYSGATS